MGNTRVGLRCLALEKVKWNFALSCVVEDSVRVLADDPSPLVLQVQLHADLLARMGLLVPPDHLAAHDAAMPEEKQLRKEGVPLARDVSRVHALVFDRGGEFPMPCLAWAKLLSDRRRAR